jgi:hypothetical protein
VEERSAPLLPNISVTPGDEHLLRALPEHVLQSIVDHVAQQVAPKLSNLSPGEQALTLVEFTNGVKLRYRNWMLSRRGHDLLPIYQKGFGQNLMTPPKLEKKFRRVRLIPVELAEIMLRLQKT